MTLASASGKRFEYLDSARGFAAISVCIWHFLASFFDPLKPGWATSSGWHLFWYSEGAVVFFFVYSGFVLSYSYTGSQQPLTLSGYISFLTERLFRIYPLFLFILAVSYVLKTAVFPLAAWKYTNAHFHLFWSRGHDLNALFREAILIIPAGEPANYRLVPQDWTLGVELVVGATVPLFGFLARKNRLACWVAVAAAILIFHFNAHLIEFASGIFIFRSWKDIVNQWNKLGSFLKWSAGMVAIIFYSCFFHFSSLLGDERVFIGRIADRLLVILGAGLLFAILVSSGFVQRVLSLPLFVKIGRTCYSIYMTHMLLLICFADYFMQTLTHWFRLSQTGYLFVAFVIFMIAVLSFSYLCFRFIERPFNRLGKKMSRKIETGMIRIKTKYHWVIPPFIYKSI